MNEKWNELCREPVAEEMSQDRWMNQRFQIPCGCRGFSPRGGRKWEFLPCGAPCGAPELRVGEGPIPFQHLRWAKVLPD